MSQESKLYNIVGTTVHELGIDVKNKLAGGSCDICFDKQGHSIMRIDKFTKILSKLELGLYEYKDSMSYFYDMENEPKYVYAISFSKIDNKPAQIEEIKDLFQKEANVKPLDEMSGLMGHVKSCYPNWETSEVQVGSSKFTKQLGEVAGAVSSIFSSKSPNTQPKDLKSPEAVKENQPPQQESKSAMDKIKNFGQKTKDAFEQGKQEQKHKKAMENKNA